MVAQIFSNLFLQITVTKPFRSHMNGSRIFFYLQIQFRFGQSQMFSVWQLRNNCLSLPVLAHTCSWLALCEWLDQAYQLREWELFSVLIILSPVFLKQPKNLKHSYKRKRKAEGPCICIAISILLFSPFLVMVLHKEYWLSPPSIRGECILLVSEHK